MRIHSESNTSTFKCIAQVIAVALMLVLLGPVSTVTRYQLLLSLQKVSLLETPDPLLL